MNGVEITYAEEIDKDFDPEAEIATEVLATELGDFYSREDEELGAASWEVTSGRPCKRSWESWSDWKKRKKAFKPVRPPKPFTIDRQSAIERLTRLLKVDEPTSEQQKEVHDLEDLLERERTDFEKPRPKPEDAEKASLNRFTLIEKEEFWADRLKLVTKERDIGALNLVAMRDSHEKVRQEAQHRLLELSIR